LIFTIVRNWFCIIAAFRFNSREIIIIALGMGVTLEIRQFIPYRPSDKQCAEILLLPEAFPRNICTAILRHRVLHAARKFISRKRTNSSRTRAGFDEIARKNCVSVSLPSSFFLLNLFLKFACVYKMGCYKCSTIRKELGILLKKIEYTENWKRVSCYSKILLYVRKSYLCTSDSSLLSTFSNVSTITDHPVYEYMGYGNRLVQSIEIG